MIPRNQQNRKQRVNLLCPTCGMSLDSQAMAPFVLDNETYCCRGCAEGTGCTCAEEITAGTKAGNRKGKIGQRNRSNNVLDSNQNEEVDNSGQALGSKKTKNTPRYASRGHKTAEGTDRPRSQQKERDSTRQPSRGMSEFRGQLNNSRVQDRLSKTASKLRKPGESSNRPRPTSVGRRGR